MPISANVIKRDGRVEPFIAEKIAISCTNAGLKPDLAHSIAIEMSRKVYPNMPTTEIRKLVSKWIGKHDTKAAKAYLKYEERELSRQSVEKSGKKKTGVERP